MRLPRPYATSNPHQAVWRFSKPWPRLSLRHFRVATALAEIRFLAPEVLISRFTLLSGRVVPASPDTGMKGHEQHWHQPRSVNRDIKQ